MGWLVAPLALLIERLVGYPPSLFSRIGHPVTWMGALITWLERELNKGDARDLLTRVVGSVGFTTSVRSVIGIGEHPSDEHDRVAVLAKSNLADKAGVASVRFRVQFQPER